MAVLIFCRKVAESDVTVTPSVTCMDWLCWWYNHTAHVVSSSAALAFVTNMSGKHRSTSPSAIQVKNRWKTVCVEEKGDVSCQLDKVNELVTYGIMLDLLILAYVQFVIMLTELQKVLSWELKCLFGKTTIVLSERTVPNTKTYIFLH
jgi:hypothetical protein